MGSWLGWCVTVDTEFKYVVRSPVSAIYTRAYLLIHSGEHFLTLARLFFFSVAFFSLARLFLAGATFFFTGATSFAGATSFCWRDFFLVARLLFAGVSVFFFRWRDFFSGLTF